MNRHHLASEEGMILATTIILLAIMVGLALASFSMVDTGQERTREQRQRESSLNVTEGVLYAQGFKLAQEWPGNEAQGLAMPPTCLETPQAAALQQFCPTPGTLAAANGSPATANFANVDALADVTWTTRIRDNGGPSLAGAYVSAASEATQTGTNVKNQPYTCAGPCRWDANGDRQLWVEASGIVRGKPRKIVALLKREVFSEGFPRGGVVAGSFETTNSGNKTIIDSTGSQVIVRCTTALPACTNYNISKDHVLPTTIVRDATFPSAMTAAQRERFKIAAQSADPPTYYTSCPTSLAGAVVFIDVPGTTDCSANYNATYNSATSPGIVIMPAGTMSGFKGVYHGILYLGNAQNSSGIVLGLAANSQVCGGVAIDGPGRLFAGQASNAASACDPTRDRSTIMFRDNAFNSLATFGTTGLVQNTWRELPAGT